MMKIHSIAFSVLLLSAAALAGSPDNRQVDARAAFDRLKALAGEWQADTPRGKAQVRYELIAGGSVLVEHDNMPGEGEMMTAYHLDGDRLVLTHYCMAGNQPHMVADRFNSQTGELDFAFAGAGNLKSGAAHMHNARFHLISADRFDTAWELFEGGKLKLTADLHYSRVN
jgi:hypothetical protein